MDKNRKTAYQTLMDVEGKRAYSNIALNHRIIINKPDSQAFVRKLVYGVLEKKFLLDFIIDKLAEKGIQDMKNPEKTILRMGIYQIMEMSSVPEYAAINESVKLAKTYVKSKANFINGMLRAFTRERYTIRIPDRSEDEMFYLSTKYSCEPWIIELWLETYKVDQVEEMLKSTLDPSELTIRVNQTRARKKDLKKELESQGFKVSDGKMAANALNVEGTEIINSKLYKAGLFSIQDEASQMVAELIAPKGTDFIIDVCAAPGGKTLAIAEKMESRGEIIAQDIYKRKVDIINKEAERLGLRNITTRSWDGTRVDSTLIDKADKVLVDAPCSGLGVMRRKPEIKYKKYTGEMKRLPDLQLAILSASSKYVKKGGVLIYSTCTINTYENERVVKDFIRKNPSFKIVEEKLYLPNVDNVDGFYICKMKREKFIV